MLSYQGQETSCLEWKVTSCWLDLNPAHIPAPKELTRRHAHKNSHNDISFRNTTATYDEQFRLNGKQLCEWNDLCIENSTWDWRCRQGQKFLSNICKTLFTILYNPSYCIHKTRRASTPVVSSEVSLLIWPQFLQLQMAAVWHVSLRTLVVPSSITVENLNLFWFIESKRIPVSPPAGSWTEAWGGRATLPELSPI